ncbi:MAG TPA: hypothetical protein VG146_02790, partial [Verrucomicrobiae bacterium]|nr:hypothetical protein [Verrucomicrobiae bacterium]
MNKALARLASIGFITFLAAQYLMADEIWTLTTAPYNSWVQIASSDDGRVLIAAADLGSLYVSTNSGAAWTAATNAPDTYWVCVCISADGSKMAGGVDGGSIYVSSDYGVTWSQTDAPINYWKSITCSADGSKLAAAAISDGLYNQVPGQIHLSKDSGATWFTPDSTATNSQEYSEFWLAIASSSDGSKLVAANAGGSIYISEDSGNTWSLTGAPYENWFSVASSTNGNLLVAVAYAGPIYASTNSGVTWTPATNAPNAGWASVASSADGRKLAAVQLGGQIYTSDDAGTTWLQNGMPNTFLAGGVWGIASSKDGSKLLACGDGPYGGPIYLLQPSPVLSIAHTRTNIVLSWPTSASGFMLQQATDDLRIQNWTNV